MINFFGRRIVKTWGRLYPWRVFVQTPLTMLVYKGHSSSRRRFSVSSEKSNSLTTFHKKPHISVSIVVFKKKNPYIRHLFLTRPSKLHLLSSECVKHWGGVFFTWRRTGSSPYLKGSESSRSVLPYAKACQIDLCLFEL